jgi:ABC-type multidrug transport system fused ATPase/permease subunit
MHEKLLRVPSGGAKGKIATLVGSDAPKLGDLGTDIHYVWASPLMLLVALGLCWRLLGVAILPGIGVAVLLMPINFTVMSGMSNTQEAIQRHQQRRMAATSEAVGSILGVKLLGWERRVAGIIGASRAMELRHVRKFMYTIACLMSVAWSLSTLMACASFAAYALLGGRLSASVIFPALYLLQLTTWPMLQLPYVIGSLASACTSMNRVTRFLNGREVAAGHRVGGGGGGEACAAKAALAQESAVDRDAKALAGGLDHRREEPAIQLEGATLRWPKPSRITSRPTSETGRSAPSAGGRLCGCCRGDAHDGSTRGGDASRGAGSTVHTQRLLGADHLAADSSAAVSASPASKGDAGLHPRGSGGVKAGSHRPAVLHNITLSVPRGQLVAVVGPVGSGKSSLLAALLGEMEDATGSADDNSGRDGTGVVGVRGPVGLVPQTAWVRSLSVRENVDLGLAAAPSRGGGGRGYAESVRVCCLDTDLMQLSQGEDTQVGESGVSLSGGQRARITLARALRSGTDTFLLDDPLSAVDAHVGAELFHSAIRGTLSGCTRVLVTHQLQFLPSVDRVLVMKEGRIEHDGSYEELVAAGVEFASLLEASDGSKPSTADDAGDGLTAAATGTASSVEAAAASAASVTLPAATGFPMLSRVTSAGSEPMAVPVASHPARKPPAALVDDEDRHTGTVSAAVYWAYARSLGGCGFAVRFAILSLGLELLSTASSALLALWANASSGALVHPPPFATSTNPPLSYWLTGYLSMGILVAVVSLVRNFTWFGATCSASKTLHDRVVGGLLRAPMRFWTATPSGRVLNRMSNDVSVVDQDLPDNISDVLLCIVEIAARIATIGVAAPVFLIIFAPLVLFYWVVAKYYRASSRELKRLEAISGSPVQARFSDTVDGLASIRAFGLQGSERSAMRRSLDNCNTAEFASRMAALWISVRIEGSGSLLVAAVGALAVATTVPAVEGWLGGVKALLPLALTYAIGLTGSFNWLVRCASSTEAEFSRVERLYHFAGLQPEAPLVGSGRLCEEEECAVARPVAAAAAGAAKAVADTGGGRCEASSDSGAEDDVTLSLGVPSAPLVQASSTGSDRLFRAASRMIKGASDDDAEAAWAGTEELRRQSQTPGELRRTARAWPRSGSVELRGAWMRYRPDLEPVLRGVSVRIPAGCRVGIVGRTGAGKSSLFAALFRTVELCKGSILLDGVDMSTIGLRAVRSAIAAVPQEPVMWSGTLRAALDPCGPVKVPLSAKKTHRAESGDAGGDDESDEESDEEEEEEDEDDEDHSATERGDAMSRCLCGDPTLELTSGECSGAIRWDPEWKLPEAAPPSDELMLEALRAVGLGEWVEAFSLDGLVEEGGKNLSLGTRQLLALARTLLRDCRVVALDEATASVSPAEDNCIQMALLTAFRGRTVLTIAHRLPTVIGYDRILVMNAGKREEWGTPAQLLGLPGADESPSAEPHKRVTGMFASMVANTGPETERLLRAAAAKTFTQ